MGDLAEIKTEIEKVHRTFTEFKEANDTRIKAIEAKGTAGGDREEKVDRINKAVDDMLDRVKTLETANNRPEVGAGGDKKEVEEHQRQVKAAYEKFVRKGERSLSPEEVKLLSTDSDPAGGYLVPGEMSSDIKQKVFETTPMRQLASVITISSGYWEEPADWSEAEVETPGERGTRNETDTPEFSMLRIHPHNIDAKPEVTQNMLDDSGINVEQYLKDKVAEKVARTENTWFVSGNGVNQARGILGYPAADAYGSIEQVSSGVSGSFTADNLMDFQDTLLEAFQPNASWLMRRATRTYIRKLKDGNGNYLWSIDRGLNNRVQESILGQPLFLGSDMPAIGADALVAAYGDFKKAYAIVDRMGIRQVRDIYTKPGFVKFITSKRTGGAARHYQALKLFKLAV